MSNVQWYLVELDRYGNPTLVDGGHNDREGANKAAYLIEAMGLKRDRKFAVAKIEISEVQPSSSGVNHAAVAELNRASLRSSGGDRG